MPRSTSMCVSKKYLTKDILAIFTQQPEVLPPWDPMFSFER